MKRDQIDFAAVPVHQQDMDERLVNWARWARPGTHSSASPMFRLYRSSETNHAPEVREPIDVIDASRIAKGIVHLPEKHRHSLGWHYVTPVAPMRACRALAVSMAGLAQMVVDARQMLINRRV